MIKLFTGTPGSGKSYNAVREALIWLRAGRKVIANFALKFTDREKKKGMDQRFTYLTNDEITISRLVMYAIDNGMLEFQHEAQCLVIIDEAGGRFNSREFGKTDRKEWIDFFSQHRKLGFDFILVAQADRMIDKQIRGYIEYEIKHRRANRVSVFRYIPWVKIFVAVQYWYQQRQRMEAEWIMLKKKTANKYDHMKMFSGFTLNEETIQRLNELRGIETPITTIFNEDGEEAA